MEKLPETHSEFAELLRLELSIREAKERNNRRKDDYSLPDKAYETIEDLGKIEAAMAVLKTFWHRDNEDYRKASMHLSKLSWDLRKQAQQVALDGNNC